MGYWKVIFEKELPSSADITTRYYAQTGLGLGLIANLQLQTIKTSATDVFNLLQQDAAAVARLEHERQAFYQAHAGQYEEMARIRDQTKDRLKPLNYVVSVQFKIEGFYEVDFSVEGNEIEIEVYSGQGYGIESLLKVLIDLGGKFNHPDRDINQNRLKTWKKLKKWDEYKWYNRPRK